jgi:iron complex outermembrane recepter protein
MRFKRANFLISSALVSLCSAAAAQGQTTPAPPPTEDAASEIVVTGIRSSLAQAAALKRDSAQFVDAIVAEDIGKLPDANVAESLQRVSGVQVDRGIGEGTDVSVRGLRQNVILFNGRQVFDAYGRGGQGPDTLASSTYGLLSLIPSDLISRLEVTKLASSREIEGALGGVVNIVSRRPLDKAGFHGSASATGVHGVLGKHNGYELFGLLSTTTADDTLGFLISASRSNRIIREDGLNTFSGYGTLAGVTLTGPTGLPVSTDSNGDGVVGSLSIDPRIQQILDDRTRTGATATIQWRPSDKVEVILDAFYSKVESDRRRYWLAFGGGGGSYRNAVLSKNDVLLSGTSDRTVQSNSEFARAKSEVFSTALSVKWNISDTLEAFGEFDYSKSTADLKQRFYRFVTTASVPISFDLTAGSVPNYNLGTGLDNPSRFNLAIIFDNATRPKTNNAVGRLDFKWKPEGSFLTSFDFGVRYSDQKTDLTQINRDVRGAFPATTIGPITGVFSSPDFLQGLAPDLVRSFVAANYEQGSQGCTVLSAFYNAAQTAACANQVTPLASFAINEKFLSGYILANFGTELFGRPLSGNYGLRYVNRKLRSEGTLVSPTGALTPNVVNRSLSDWLPSAVVKLDATDKLVVRLGAARVLSYPNTADLNNGLQVFGDNTGRGGSPLLDPFLVNQLDLSAELYMGGGAALTVGAFYKDVESFIVERLSNETIPGFAQPINVARKINGAGGTIKGIEVLFQQPFTFLPAPFDGFGVLATYSYIDSKTPFRDRGGQVLPIPGLSKNNVNLVGYYENDDFGVRVAYNWRDKYLTGLGFSNSGIFNDTYADLNASVRLNVTKDIAVDFEAINLLNTQQRLYVTYPEAVQRAVQFGRVFKLTLRADF